MREYLQEHTNPPVFIASAIVVIALVTFGAAAPPHSVPLPPPSST